MKYKSDTRPLLVSFYNMICTQFHTKIKVFRIDNAPEFFLKDFFSENGIIHQHSCVATPQQNSIVERKHQHILSMARALRFQSNVPLYLWGECVLTAVHIINRLSSPILNNKSPFEKLYGKIPSYEHLKVFSCLCFASTLIHDRTKFDPRFVPCVFLGYPFGVKGYKLRNQFTKRIFISRDVLFHETIFPFVLDPYSSSFHSNIPLPHLFPSVASPYDPLIFFPTFDLVTDAIPAPDQVIPPTFESISTAPIPNPTPSLSSTFPVLDQLPIEVPSMSNLPHVSGGSPIPTTVTDVAPNLNTGTSTPSLRRSQRVSKPPTYLQSYKCSLVLSDQFPHSTSSIKSGSLPPTSGTNYSLSSYLSTSKLSTSYANFCSLITNIPEPKSYFEAVKNPKWQEAMDIEIAALEANNTWTFTPLPPHKRAVGCKWVYRVKYRSDGSIERYKARLVVKGLHNKRVLILLKLSLMLPK